MNEAFPFGDRNTVVTVGTFDGVHLGHRAVLEEIARRARGLGLASLLVTFEPHPLAIVNPENQPHLLTLPNERREVLAQCDVDYVAFLPFTRNLSQYTPRQFIKLLLDRFGMTELVIGYDHGLGRGRAGDVAVLTRLGQELDFAVDVVDAVTELRRPRPVSSTLIRRAVAGGDLETAAELLGRPYSMTGIGGTGAGRGKGLGFPTINVPPPPEEKLLPPDGVYAVTVEWSAGSAAGMLNQGPRPTFDDHRRVIEAHLFDFDGELHGREIKISWIRRLRDVQKFDSATHLAKQLERDAADARNALTQVTLRASH